MIKSSNVTICPEDVGKMSSGSFCSFVSKLLGSTDDADSSHKCYAVVHFLKLATWPDFDTSQTHLKLLLVAKECTPLGQEIYSLKSFCAASRQISYSSKGYKLLHCTWIHITSTWHTNQTRDLWFKAFYCFFSLENNTKSCNKSYVLLWVNWNQPRGTVKCFYGLSSSREETPGNPGRGSFQEASLLGWARLTYRGRREVEDTPLARLTEKSRFVEITLQFGFLFPWVTWLVGGKIRSQTPEFFNLQVTLTWRKTKQNNWTEGKIKACQPL